MPFTHLLGSLVPSVVASIITQQRFCICYCSTFFFKILSSLKFVLLATLIQVPLQVWECLIMCYETKPNVTFPFPNHIPKDKTIFQTTLNSLMFHQCKLTSTFDLLFDTNFGDWVKARSTTWEDACAWVWNLSLELKV